MHPFHEVSPVEWTANPFRSIGENWMLVTAQNGETANPMTASWGSFGVLWHKPVACVYIRPSRLTHQLMTEKDTFSLAFLDESFREQYKICGKDSGRDVDKPEKCGFTIAYDGETPYIEQAHTVVFCRKLYHQPLQTDCFTDEALGQHCYADTPDNVHDVFVGEITKIFTR